MEVPIIDDDTTNISGYVDSFITFDIDTAATDINCDATGGEIPVIVMEVLMIMPDMLLTLGS